MAAIRRSNSCLVIPETRWSWSRNSTQDLWETVDKAYYPVRSLARSASLTSLREWYPVEYVSPISPAHCYVSYQPELRGYARPEKHDLFRSSRITPWSYPIWRYLWGEIPHCLNPKKRQRLTGEGGFYYDRFRGYSDRDLYDRYNSWWSEKGYVPKRGRYSAPAYLAGQINYLHQLTNDAQRNYQKWQMKAMLNNPAYREYRWQPRARAPALPSPEYIKYLIECRRPDISIKF